ncbi:putative pyruvate dehydrogenase (acetyl-transferring) [Helianthus annuus]|nr:putative pyruvate dehydrogenase (acetyl-transferring) [Helianthus annuus]
MDADERLMALKKAYADIILNTGKEAAKRIMVSERKAVWLEYELKIAKEDAVQMLIRVKQMMDCKVCFGLRFEKGLGLCCLGVWFRFRLVVIWGISCGLVSARINISSLGFGIGRMLVMSRGEVVEFQFMMWGILHYYLFVGGSASIVEDSFGYLDAPVERIARANVPTPYVANLERMAFPQVKDRAFCLLNLWVTSALHDGVTQTTTTTIPSIISPIAKLLIGLL